MAWNDSESMGIGHRRSGKGTKDPRKKMKGTSGPMRDMMAQAAKKNKGTMRPLTSIAPRTFGYGF